MTGSAGIFATVCFCVFGLMAVLVLVILATSIRVVPEHQRLTVFRLGQKIGERGPGLVILMPFIDRAESSDVHDH